MRKKLQHKLFEKYPKIFRQKDLSMSQTCMCWGIACGDGWYNLLNSLCYCVQSFINNHPDVNQMEAVQVKEKFGGLSFYTTGSCERIEGMIQLAAELSYQICENCGSIKNVSQTKGWIITLCGQCLARRKENE